MNLCKLRRLSAATSALALLAASTITWAQVTPAPSASPSTQPSASPTPGAPQDIVATLTAMGQFTVLLQAVQAAGLTDTLKSAGPFTVFAPTDSAFAQVPAANLQAVLQNPTLLKEVITYHVIPGSYTTAQLVSMGTVNSQEGEPLTFTMSGSQVKVDQATITQADVPVSNGLVNVINAILLPPSLTPGASPSPSPSASPSP